MRSKSLSVIVIEPPRGWQPLGLRELVGYRELLYFLTWRDVVVRYKQAVLGVGWAIIQPLLTMVVFSVIFGQLAQLPSEGIPYPVFTYAALLPWQLFAGSLQRAGTSLVGNANLLTKVYFPRLIIPISAVLAGLVDFGVSFVVLLGLMVYYGLPITWTVLWLVPLTVLTVFAALSVSLWLSALNVLYRDVQYVIPFMAQLWMYISPVAYSAALVPDGRLANIYALNPMTGVIEGFRWSLFGGTAPVAAVGLACLVVVLLLAGGLLYFRRMEKVFADVV